MTSTTTRPHDQTSTTYDTTTTKTKNTTPTQHPTRSRQSTTTNPRTTVTPTHHDPEVILLRSAEPARTINNTAAAAGRRTEVAPC